MKDNKTDWLTILMGIITVVGFISIPFGYKMLGGFCFISGIYYFCNKLINKYK